MLNFAIPWAIKEETLRGFYAVYQSGDHPLVSSFTAKSKVKSESIGQVAVIPVAGPLMKQLDFFAQIFGGVTYSDIQSAITGALNDPGIKAIILKIDSPGGSVAGAFELSDFIFQARSKKRIIAYVDSNMMSAAYLLGSATEEIIAPASAMVGSIGVISIYYETSKMDESRGLKYTIIKAGKYKSAGNTVETMSKESREYLQSLNDYYYSLFIDAVSRNRGISTEKALSMADGKVFIGAQALDIGLVDSIGNFDYAFLRALATGSQTVKTGARATTSSYAEMLGELQQTKGISRAEAARLLLQSERGRIAFLAGVK